MWCNVRSMPVLRAVAAAVFVSAIALPPAGARAELLFRAAQQEGGQQRWSPAKKYSDAARISPGAPGTPAQEVRVFITGEITARDAVDARVMESLLRSGRQKLAGNTVWLASGGGDVDAAMELGRLFRTLGVYTIVGRNDQCVSACVFAFMGGERRMVSGQLGIHRPYFPTTQESADRRQRFRHLQRTLRDYIEEMDFPPSFYEAVMLVPPEAMKILDPADLKRFYLQGISPSSEDLADAAAARRLKLPMQQYLKRKASAPACVFPVPGKGGCESHGLDPAFAGTAADDSWGGQASEPAR